MAKSVKYHLTPEGPKPCNATMKACPYGEHYSSAINAAIAMRNEEKANAEEARLKEIRDLPFIKSPKVFRHFDSNGILGGPHSARLMDTLIRDHQLENKARVGYMQLGSTLDFTEKPSGKRWRFRLRGSGVFDKDVGKMVGRWVVEWWELDGWGNKDPVTSPSVIDLERGRNVRPLHPYFRKEIRSWEGLPVYADFKELSEQLSEQFRLSSNFKTKTKFDRHPYPENWREIWDAERAQHAHEQITQGMYEAVMVAQNQMLGPWDAAKLGFAPFEYEPDLHIQPGFNVLERYDEALLNGRMVYDYANDERALAGPVLTREETGIAIWSEDTPDKQRWVVRHRPKVGWMLEFLEAGEKKPYKALHIQDEKAMRDQLFFWHKERYGKEFALDRWDKEGAYAEELVYYTERAFLRREEVAAEKWDRVEALASQNELFIKQDEEPKGGFKKLFELFS